MSQINTLTAQKLRSFCEKGQFTFTTTDEVSDHIGMVGQDRATEALSFGIEMDKPGYNMYLMGSNGLGKQTLLNHFLEKASAEKKGIYDYCYVYNFENPNQPLALKLPAGQARDFANDMQKLSEEIDTSLSKIFSESDKASRKKHIDIEIKKLIRKLAKDYSEMGDVTNHLTAIEKDLFDSISTFCGGEHDHLPYEECVQFIAFQNYEVNLLVKQAIENAPVIFEDNPTKVNLFGKVEYISQMGSLVTDYHYIKSGSLHKANGGYLVVDADKLIDKTDVWETFKRTLKNNEINIPSSELDANSVYLVSMQPEAIALNVKIILVGSRSTYNKLVDNDDDFSELFKVEVDFSETIDCTKESLNQYAQVIATLVRKNNLLAFDQAAVKCVIEFGMRQIEDTTQLSTHMHSIQELLIEADYWAKKGNNSKVVTTESVKLAIEKQIYRADRYRENMYREIDKGSIFFDVTGEKVASVNGLFVIESGRLEFAQPARITANVRIGDGDIIDIEREVDLGGPLHSKGVLILSSYLGAHYALDKPLSFSASLVFEQSYGSVDGDSATIGELCALLSAISNLPVKQSLAITGSADQHGNIQAIGGINEKIEGFYDICKLKGFTGEQGVVMPAINVQHLILRDDVVDAIENNKFYLYAVSTIDEAISLLTGLPAGIRNDEGKYPEGSVNFKVEKHLLELAELKHDDKEEHEHEHDKETKKDK